MTKFRLLYATADLQDAARVRVRLADAAELEVVETAARCSAALVERVFDVAVLDHALPGHDGLALVAELRAAGHQLPILVVTADGDDAMAVRALELGATDFLPRSADHIAALPVRLRGVLARGSAPPYRQILDATDEGIWMIDAAAVTTFVNPGMARMLGYTVDEMRGRGLLEFMDDTGRAIATRNLERRRDGIAEPHDFVFRRKDGAALHASLTTNPIIVAGRYAGALAVVRDITDRERAAEQLRVTEERFRSLFEHSPNCLWEEDGTELKVYLDQLRASGVTDMRAYLSTRPDEVMRCMTLVKVLDVNQASVRHYEAGDKASLLAGFGRTLTPESYAVFTDVIVGIAEGKTVIEAETTDLTFTGRKNHVLLKSLVAPGSEDTLSKVYVSIVDITARKEAEEQVRALALFPELNPTAVLRLSADGAIAYANPAAQTMAHSLGTELARLVPEETPAIVAEVLATGKGRPVHETKRGTRTLAWSFHPIVSHQVVHCYAVDITERLQLEEELRQSQKMDAIGHLAGGIAHDFNNLLTVICANTALLQRARPSESLESIAIAADRAAALVRQLLAFSRRQVLQMCELELNRTVVNLVKMLERVVREDVEVRVELADQPVWTRADAGLLDQVLMNLVVNARDAMPKGGSLVLSTSLVWVTDDDRHVLPDSNPGPYACVRVRDTGLGIPPENLPHIFEPFFTTKEVGRGTGLGLATVFGIVKQHGGALSVTSELDRGTTFTVLLPYAGDRAQPEVDRPALEPTSRGGIESILVVEDETPVRDLVQRVLAMHGYRVRVVSTGAEAWALGAATTLGFDLVLTDLVMPGGISGLELATRLQATKPDLKVIYMSGYPGELAGHELREGVNFLQKPFRPTQLLACVRDRLDAD